MKWLAGLGLGIAIAAPIAIALMRAPPAFEAPRASAIAATPVPLPPQPAPTSAIDIACPNWQRVRAEMSPPGDVLVEFVVDTGGRVHDAQVVRSTAPAFDPIALAAVQRFTCISQGQEVRVRVPFDVRRER